VFDKTPGDFTKNKKNSTTTYRRPTAFFVSLGNKNTLTNRKSYKKKIFNKG
jgi:hypothetical protein